MTDRPISKEEFLNVFNDNTPDFLTSFHKLQSSPDPQSFDSISDILSPAGLEVVHKENSSVTILLPGTVSQFDFSVGPGSGDIQSGAATFSLAVAESAARLISGLNAIPKQGIRITLRRTQQQGAATVGTSPSFVWDLNATLPAGSVGFSREDLSPKRLKFEILLISGNQQRLLDSLGKILTELPRALSRKLNTLSPARFVFTGLDKNPSESDSGFQLTGHGTAFDTASLEQIRGLVLHYCQMFSESNGVLCRIDSNAPPLPAQIVNPGIRLFREAAQSLFESHMVSTSEYPSIYAENLETTTISLGVASGNTERDSLLDFDSALLSAIQLLAFSCLS